jgi:hypothetical protein
VVWWRNDYKIWCRPRAVKKKRGRNKHLANCTFCVTFCENKTTCFLAVTPVRRSGCAPRSSYCGGTPAARSSYWGAASEGDSVRGSPCDEPARLRTSLQGSIPADPGIRGPLHPPRHRSPPSLYRIGTPRSGASPEAAHRLSRCTASAGTEPWRPASLCPPFFLLRGYPRERIA